MNLKGKLLLQVDKYMLEILDDLLVNLTSTQWRVRESRYVTTTKIPCLLKGPS
jgi:hypothetical protein